MWVTLLLQERLLGFCSIYAPNSSLAHSHLWDLMASYLPDVDWIVGGDFNMMKWEGDRGGGAEKQAWSRCMVALQFILS